MATPYPDWIINVGGKAKDGTFLYVSRQNNLSLGKNKEEGRRRGESDICQKTKLATTGNNGKAEGEGSKQGDQMDCHTETRGVFLHSSRGQKDGKRKRILSRCQDREGCALYKNTLTKRGGDTNAGDFLERKEESQEEKRRDRFLTMWTSGGTGTICQAVKGLTVLQSEIQVANRVQQRGESGRQVWAGLGRKMRNHSLRANGGR